MMVDFLFRAYRPHPMEIYLLQTERDYWVIKIDGSGNLLWEKSLGGNGTDVCYTISQTLVADPLLREYQLHWMALYPEIMEKKITGSSNLMLRKCFLATNVRWQLNR